MKHPPWKHSLTFILDRNFLAVINNVRKVNSAADDKICVARLRNLDLFSMRTIVIGR
jgi:hypothetical protein